ncbi:MAG: dihydrodipicolinate synthase family protein [Candidatus Hydrogenedentes bacterium]|nr:dihydrodipicolinate synthase family protein [Candidatus Hydrogenedentota bacterium]
MNVPDFLHTTIAPVLTAFHDDDAFDETSQRNLLDYMLSLGEIGAYFIRSGMGQMYAYSYDDVFRVSKICAAHLDGRAPWLLNCSGIWDGDRSVPTRPDPDVYMEQALAFQRHAEDSDAAAVVHVLPEALLPVGRPFDIDQAYPQYFESVCAETTLPVVIYQPPGMPANVNLTPQVLARLAGIPNLVGCKVSSRDGIYMFDLIRSIQGKDFHFITGTECLFFATLYAGSRGVIGVGSNLFPRVLNVLRQRFLDGDRDGVLEAQESVNRLFHACPYARITMKRLATDGGYPVGLAYRGGGANPYGDEGLPCTDENYQAYKHLLERELAKYA